MFLFFLDLAEVVAQLFQESHLKNHSESLAAKM